MQPRISKWHQIALVCWISGMVLSESHAQIVNIRIPMARLDSVFKVSDGQFLGRRVDTVWFGVHVNGSNCSDTNMCNFATKWAPDDTGCVFEYEQPQLPGAEFLLTKPKRTSTFACDPAQGLQIDIRHFSDTTQRDTFKLLALRDVLDSTESHRYTFSWPGSIGNYYDSCIFLAQVRQLGSKNVDSIRKIEKESKSFDYNFSFI